MEATFDTTKTGTEKGYLTIRDGQRGVVRLHRGEVQELADLLACSTSR